MPPYKTLVLITSANYQHLISEEKLQAILSLALFDQPHAVIFWHHGLSWLVADQKPQQSKSLSKQLSALPLYGSDALFYCQEHQALMGHQPLLDLAKPLALSDIAELLKTSQQVEVF